VRFSRPPDLEGTILSGVTEFGTSY
jgi:hypothetical protein